MARPQWLSGSRKSMERIGFLKLSVLLAPSTGCSLAEFTEAAKERINSTVRVRYDSGFAHWLSINGLESGRKSERATAVPEDMIARLQHWWVFNNTPSRSGWLSRLAVPEYFEVLPRKSGLLESDFVPSELGRTLQLGFMSGGELEAWSGKVVSSTSPLLLTEGQRLFFLYLIMKVDGDFLLPLIEQLVSQFGTAPFDYLDAGRSIPPALECMASSFGGSAISDDDHKEMAKIRKAREDIERHIEERVEKRGSGSTREQKSIPRLEWLVDLGVLKKEDTRSYEFTERGLVLAQKLTACYRGLLSRHYPEDCLSILLDQHFFEPVMEFLRGTATRCDTLDCLRLLREAYEDLRGPMGYVLLRSLVLLLHGRQPDIGMSVFVEYSDALAAVEAEHREHPQSTYYTVDRLGNEYQVKFSL